MAIRSPHFFLFKVGIFTNPMLVWAVLLTFGLQMALIYVPVLQGIFSTQALSLKELGGCILVSLVVFHAVEAEKFVRHLVAAKRKR
jgi:Ca2+-transporting ATPase